jgi:hypothetical protein
MAHRPVASHRSTRSIPRFPPRLDRSTAASHSTPPHQRRGVLRGAARARLGGAHAHVDMSFAELGAPSLASSFSLPRLVPARPCFPSRLPPPLRARETLLHLLDQTGHSIPVGLRIWLRFHAGPITARRCARACASGAGGLGRTAGVLLLLTRRRRDRSRDWLWHWARARRK